MQEWLNKVHIGNALEVLKELPDESVNMTITSPPYWALRDYGQDSSVWGGDKNCNHEWQEEVTTRPNSSGGQSNKTFLSRKGVENFQEFTNYHDRTTKSDFCLKCGAWKGQLGLEPTFELYIDHLCTIFGEVKRATKKDGTCWVNLGDTYGTTSGGMNQIANGDRTQYGNLSYKWDIQKRNKPKQWHKCLLQIPFRFSIEMCNRGWILRNVIIWHKSNSMPSSIKDRFTVDFEYLFFYAKNTDYYFEQQFEKYLAPMDRWGGEKVDAYKGKYTKSEGEIDPEKSGSPRARALRPNYPERSRDLRPNPEGRNKRCVWKIPTKPYMEAHFAVFPPKLIETPIRAGCPEGGIVLDPFIGSGTTGRVAKSLKRNYIGIDIQKKYLKFSNKRISNVQLEMF